MPATKKIPPLIREVVVVPVVLNSSPTAKAHLIFKKIRSNIHALSDHPSFLVDLDVEGMVPRKLTIVHSALLSENGGERWFAQGQNDRGYNDALQYAYGSTPSEAYEKFATAHWPN